MLKQVVVAAAHISDVLPMGRRLAFANGEHSEYLAVLVDEFGVVIVGLWFWCVRPSLSSPRLRLLLFEFRGGVIMSLVGLWFW